MPIDTVTAPRAGVRPKEFRFPVAVEWLRGRRVAARVGGKASIEVMPPPVFRGTDPTAWSPEDFLVGAVASCFAVTFTGLAERAALPFAGLRVEADGICGTRDDGRFGFTRVILRGVLEVDAADVAEAQRLVEKAEENCLVAVSLDLPVETLVEVVPNSPAWAD